VWEVDKIHSVILREGQRTVIIYSLEKCRCFLLVFELRDKSNQYYISLRAIRHNVDSETTVELSEKVRKMTMSSSES
jgi:hypothetical protein